MSSELQRQILIPSFPRSGNTFLRQVLWQCFGFHSTSIYQNDLGGKQELAQLTGHLEDESGRAYIPSDGSLVFIKTHEFGGSDRRRQIYVHRDGRAATVSMYFFYKKKVSLRDIILGRHRFGCWGAHVASWGGGRSDSEDRLLLGYDDLEHDLRGVISRIELFLGVRAVRHSVLGRDEAARKDGQWIRAKSDWRDVLDPELESLFWQVNGSMMEELGYS